MDSSRVRQIHSSGVLCEWEAARGGGGLIAACGELHRLRLIIKCAIRDSNLLICNAQNYELSFACSSASSLFSN